MLEHATKRRVNAQNVLCEIVFGHCWIIRYLTGSARQISSCCTISLHSPQEVVRPQKVHPREKWSVKGLLPRIHSNAEDSQAEDFITLPEILQPRVCSVDNCAEDSTARSLYNSATYFRHVLFQHTMSQPHAGS